MGRGEGVGDKCVSGLKRLNPGTPAADALAMAHFQGTMRIAGDGGPPVPVRARVGDHRLALEVEGVTVGEWPVDGLDAAMDREGVVLRLGEEHVTLDVSDRTGFVTALSAPVPSAPHRRRRRPSLPLIAMIATMVGVVTAAVLAPQLVGSVALLIGLVVLVVGALAHSEPRVALRLPLNLQSFHLLAAGVLLLAVGTGLVMAA